MNLLLSYPTPTRPDSCQILHLSGPIPIWFYCYLTLHPSDPSLIRHYSCPTLPLFVPTFCPTHLYIIVPTSKWLFAYDPNLIRLLQALFLKILVLSDSASVKPIFISNPTTIWPCSYLNPTLTDLIPTCSTSVTAYCTFNSTQQLSSIKIQETYSLACLNHILLL